MARKPLPWGVHRIGNMFGSRNEAAGLPDGRWVRAVVCPFYAPMIGAWWVLTGRAHAVVWPEPGELEEALSR